MINKQFIHKKTFLKYTGLFLFIGSILFSVFILQGKSFIWEGDGYHQHYPFFREYLNILRTFLKTGEWQSWDWSIGLGADTLLTYGYYVVGDPFVYLGLLFRKGSEELAFHIIMLIRIWTVGVSYLFYARKMQFSEKSALAATIIYTFSHFVIYNVVRHPFFIHPLIFFPLIALGIEKVFQKESGALFSLMIGLSAISNFYFFYMLTFMAFLYAVVRYSYYQKWNNWAILWRKFLSFIGLYILGLLFAAVVFLPQVYGFLNASRSASFPPLSLFVYPLHYYILLVVNTITPGTIYWSVGGFSVVAVLCLPYLFKNRSEKRGLFPIFILLSLMLLFPFMGSLMNGGAGPYNRFTFVFPFYFAILLGSFLDRIHEMTHSEIKWIKYLMIVFTIFYGLISFITSQFLLYFSPVLLGWVTYFVFKNHTKLPSFKNIMIALVALNMLMNALNFYLPHGKNGISETENYGMIDENYRNVFKGVEQNLPKDEWYRVGVTAVDNHLRNQYASLDINGLNSYASLTNGAIAEFSESIESSQYQIIQPLRNGIDDRRIANQALGVKYILTDEKNLDYLPSDYEVNEELSDLGMLVAETENAAPFAYVEQDFVLESSLENMHPIQRESILAEAVILEYKSAQLNVLSELPEILPHDFSLEVEDGLEFIEADTLEIKVTKEDSALILNLDLPEQLVGQEAFLYIEGIDFQPLEDQLLIQESTQYRLNAGFNKQEKRILQSDRFRFSSYFKRENILIHFNEVLEAEESLVLKFENTGLYDFDRVTLVTRPYNQAEGTSFAEAKNDRALKIETFESDLVIGTIENEEEGMLVTSIPYSVGWSAYVDGNEVPTEKVNIGFVGLPLEAGKYTVEFVYETPYLKLGLALSTLGLVGIVVVDRWKGKK